jgi:predicted RNase H-like HicB family nuclease
MSDVPFSATVEDDRLMLRGLLDDSEGVIQALQEVFKPLLEEEETNRAASIPDDPEFAEWQAQNPAEPDENAKSFHVNYLSGPAYRSIIVDASEVTLASGGISTWINYIQKEAYLISLRYDQSVLAEVIQLMGDKHGHPRTVFLCPSEALNDKKRLLDRAKKAAKKYHVVISKSENTYIGGMIELPGCFAGGKSPQECFDETIKVAQIMGFVILDAGEKLPPVDNAWRRKFMRPEGDEESH